MIYIYVQLLLEWKADIKHKNKQSKTVLDLIRSVDLKELLKGMNYMMSTRVYSDQMFRSLLACLRMTCTILLQLRIKIISVYVRHLHVVMNQSCWNC